MGAGPYPDAAAVHVQGDDQARDGGQGEDQDPVLAGDGADVHADVALEPVEADRAFALRQGVALPRPEDDAAGGKTAAVELGEVFHVQVVDVLGFPAVQPEITVIGVQVQLGVQRVRIEAVGHAGLVLDGGGQEEPGETQLGGRGVRRFEDNVRGVDGVAGNGDDGTAEGGVPGAVLDRDHRCVAVADEEDACSAEVDRFVDFQDLLLRGRVRAVPGRQGGLEVDGLPELLGGFAVEADLELVQGDGERIQPPGLEVGPGAEIVVTDEGVDEGVAFDDDLLSPVAEQPADGHADQHADQGAVEDEVADLAQQPPLGPQRGHRTVGVPDIHTVAAPPEHCRGVPDSRPRRHPGCRGEDQGAVLRQAGQPSGRARRSRAQRLPVRPGPGQHTPDQGEEQQDVDRGKPRRGIDIEELKGVKDLPVLGAVLDVLGHHGRVRRALRKQRPRYCRDSEQQQQKQGCPHVCQLRPRPAQHPGKSQRRGSGQHLSVRGVRSGHGCLSVRSGGDTVQSTIASTLRRIWWGRLRASFLGPSPSPDNIARRRFKRFAYPEAGSTPAPGHADCGGPSAMT